MRSKTRLTITLPPELVAEIDRLIDKRTVRNRSHAIELLLRQSLAPTVTTAVLLTGGPQPGELLPALLPIQGQALILLTVNELMLHGIRRFIVLAGGNEPQIQTVLAPGIYRTAQVHYVNERQPLGTAGALKAAEHLLDDKPFLVLHGDVATNISVRDLVRFHVEQNRLATIAVKPRPAEPRYGKVMLEGSRIVDFIPKPHEPGVGIVNTGVYLLEPEVLALIDPGVSAQLEVDVFPRLAKLGQLSAFPFQGIWYDISQPEDYKMAQLRWQQRGEENGRSI